MEAEEKRPSPKAKDWTSQSSQVEFTKYNPETKVMTVRFKKGGIYEYSEVPQEVWDASLISDSIGKFLNSVIKPKYQCRKQ